MSDQHHEIETDELTSVDDRPIDDDRPSIDDDADPDHIIHVHHALIQGKFQVNINEFDIFSIKIKYI